MPGRFPKVPKQVASQREIKQCGPTTGRLGPYGELGPDRAGQPQGGKHASADLKQKHHGAVKSSTLLTYGVPLLISPAQCILTESCMNENRY